MEMEQGSGPEKALGPKESNAYPESGIGPVKFQLERQWNPEAHKGVDSKDLEKSGGQIHTETENTLRVKLARIEPDAKLKSF